ncbi:hypothetical protein N499_0223B, partial [Wolbachia pipientis wVitA]
RYYKL